MTKLTKILKDKVLGAQIAIYSNGKNFNYNYGMRSLNENEVVNDETIFRIASISKTVVAMAALKLMEENELDINDDISNIFGFKIRNPKFPNSIITTKIGRAQSELQSRPHLVCRLLLEKKKKIT